MKRSVLALCVLITCALACGTTEVKSTVDTSRPHLSATITFNTGLYKSMMFKKMYPTYALWVEDAKSGEAWTIYVTGKAGKGKWIMADERPSSVPVWYGTRGREKAKEAAPVIDSVTSATPSGETFTHLWQVPGDLAGRTLNVYLEGNISFDYNDHYRKEAKEGEAGYSDVNGQPSIIWSAALKTGAKDAAVTPSIIGHGHVLGTDHKIDRDMSKVTTAKDIFSYIKISYTAGEKK